MTPVKFKFLFPNGEPIRNEVFKISLNKAAIHNSYTGMVYPEVLELVTDDFGEFTQELFPANQPYYVAMNLDEFAEDKPSLRFRIAVPDSATELWAEDLIVQDPIWSQAWDAEAIELIMIAKGEAQAAATAAKTSETNASNSADASKASAVASAASATASANSATLSKASQDAAKISETAAKASQTAAATSATNAAAEAVKSSTSATASAGSATQSANSATASKASQDAAKVSETNSKTSETNTKASETAAKASQTAAATSATQAAASATAAAGSATAANTAKTAAEAARDRAEAAAGTVAGVISDMGPWSAAAGTYPAKPTGSAFWKVTVAGVVNGIDYGIGDTLMYTKPLDEFYKIDNTEAVTSVAGRTGAITLTKADVQLNNVDNTSDLNKPISTATQTAINGRQPLNAKLTSISSVVLAVNDMLIADSTTTLAKIATGTMGRAVLGANTNQEARTALGLGPAANYDVVSSVYGNTTGGLGSLILRNGAFGLGSTDMADLASTDIDTVNATGFYQIANTCTNGPFTGFSGQMLVMTNATYYSTQIAAPQSNASRLYFRVSTKHATLNQAAFGPWLEVSTSVSTADALASAGWNIDSVDRKLVAIANINDQSLTTGLYQCSTTTIGDKPTGQVWGTVLITSRVPILGASGSRVSQIWISSDAVEGDAWIRWNFNGTWSSWKLLTTHSIGLGIATYAGAVGTGPSIGAATDLNDMLTSGMWHQAQNANATLAKNYPVVKAGTLFVQCGGLQITTQIYIEYNTGTLWTRGKYNADWSPWRMSWDTLTLIKTNGMLDSTSNSMLKVNDFGIGNLGDAPQLTNLDSTTQASGNYSVRGTANTTGTYPPGIISTYGQMTVTRYNANVFHQTYTPNTASTVASQRWVRTYDPSQGGFGTWERLASATELSAWGSAPTNISNSANTGMFCADVNNFDLPNGIYGCDSTTAGTKPTGQTWGVLQVTGRNFQTGRVVQTWYLTDNANFTCQTWMRLNYGRVWGPWIKLLNEGDLNAAKFTGGVTVSGTNVLRFKNEGSATAPAVIHRIDTSNYYIMVTDASDQDGSYNTLRPFSFNLTTGAVSFANGASGASPSAGDRSTRFSTTTWVGSEFTAHGFGSGVSTPVANDADVDRDGGFYATNAGAGTVTNYPVATNGMVSQMGWNGAGAGAQTFITTAQGGGRFFWRSKTSSTWQPWKEAATVADVEAKENTVAAGPTSSFYRGDKTWTDFPTTTRAVQLTGLSLATGSAVVATDTVLSAIGKLQKQSTDLNAAKEGNLPTGGSASHFLDGTKSWVDFNAKARAVVLTGLTMANSTVITTATSFIEAFGRLQAQITNLGNNKEDNLPAGGNTSHFLRGDKTWQDFPSTARGVVLSGLNTGLSGVVAAGDTILNAFGKLQKQINDLLGDNIVTTRLRANKYYDPIIVANATGTYNLDLTNTSTFELTLTGNTTLAFTNVPTLLANTVMTVLVTVKQGATARTLTLPASVTVIAPGGIIQTPVANKQQDYIFTTKNGTAWEVRAGAST